MYKYLLVIACVMLLLSISCPIVCDGSTADSSTTSVLAKPSEPGKPYTSVIVDATGLGLERCQCPKIRKADGLEVWGTVKCDPDYVINKGIVVYADTLDEAKANERCGSNPLVIKAIGRSTNAAKGDPYIADSDAVLLLLENAKSKFLDKFNVIFIAEGTKK